MFSVLAKHALPLSGLEAMNRVLDLCKFEAVALQDGGLQGTYGGHRRGHASLCSFLFDFPVHGRFLVPGGHYLLCYVHDAAPGSWCAGMPLHSNTVLLVSSDSACEVVFGAQSKVTLLMAPSHTGVTQAIQRNPGSFGLPGRMFSLFGPECHAGTALQSRYRSVFLSLIGAVDRGAHAIGDGFFDLLLDPSTLSDLFAHTPVSLSYPGTAGSQYRSLRQAVDFMRANLQRDIYIEELARVAEMSDRSLRYVFGDLLGVSPTRYLALLRLHEVGRRLSVRNAGRLSIKAVAMSCGLWDLSRFAASYRQAFGEPPSATLLRACSYAA